MKAPVFPSALTSVASAVDATLAPLVPVWLRENLLAQLHQAPFPHARHSEWVRLLNTPTLTHAQALQLHQCLHEESKQAYEQKNAHLRLRLAEVIASNPEFFKGPWYGQNEWHSLRHTLTDPTATWQDLDQQYRRALWDVELWRKCQHLVVEAIVEGDQLAQAARKAARDPNHCFADELLLVQALTERLVAAARTPGLPVCNTFRRLYETVIDSRQPSALVASMLQHLAATTTTARPA